jgi:hypothetical protein
MQNRPRAAPADLAVSALHIQPANIQGRMLRSRLQGQPRCQPAICRLSPPTSYNAPLRPTVHSLREGWSIRSHRAHEFRRGPRPTHPQPLRRPGGTSRSPDAEAHCTTIEDAPIRRAIAVIPGHPVPSAKAVRLPQLQRLASGPAPTSDTCGRPGKTRPSRPAEGSLRRDGLVAGSVAPPWRPAGHRCRRGR